VTPRLRTLAVLAWVFGAAVIVATGSLNRGNSELTQNALPEAMPGLAPGEGVPASFETEDTLPSALNGVRVEAVQGRTGPEARRFTSRFVRRTGVIIFLGRSANGHSDWDCGGLLQISPSIPAHRAIRASRSPAPWRSVTRRECTTTSSRSIRRRPVPCARPVMRPTTSAPSSLKMGAPPRSIMRISSVHSVTSPRSTRGPKDLTASVSWVGAVVGS